MGYVIEFNSLLKLPKFFDSHHFNEGEKLSIEKDGERLYPLHKPIEFCDSSYNYIGKLEVEVLTLQKDRTILEVKILKVFSETEQKVFTGAYIKD